MSDVPTLPAAAFVAELEAVTREQPIITEQLLTQVHQGLLLVDVPRPTRPSVHTSAAELSVRPQLPARTQVPARPQVPGRSR